MNSALLFGYRRDNNMLEYKCKDENQIGLFKTLFFRLMYNIKNKI